jgi:uncharacterized protein YggU (UPF0235/DUF167 family)
LSPGEVRFAVRLTPRAGADRVDGVVDGVLRARVTSPPVDGAANEALLRLVSAELGVPRRNVRLVSGAGSRTKVVGVADVPPERLVQRWPGLRP